MQCFVSSCIIFSGCSLTCLFRTNCSYLLILIALHDPVVDIIDTKPINMDNKQICLSVGQACPPINSGARMSLKASHKSSVVASPAPPVCEVLHLSKHLSPGLARGRLNSSRSVLRNLRNKVYIRMFSGQSASRSLIKYRAQAEALLEAF